MQLLYLCVCVSYCDVTLACIPVMLCVYVHSNTPVYMILCLHVRVCCRGKAAETNENNVRAAGGKVEIERKRRIYLIGWELHVLKIKEET